MKTRGFEDGNDGKGRCLTVATNTFDEQLLSWKKKKPPLQRNLDNM
jgi:hypothetical protein